MTKSAARRRQRGSPLGALVGFALKALVGLVALALPVVGVWIASSLAAYSNLHTGLVVFAGALLFPVLPLAWELHAAFRRRTDARPHILTFTDRITLRTLALNALFLAVLLASAPERSFLALSTRGDWMLDGRTGPKADRARRVLLRSASALEWLYAAARKNPFEDDQAARAQRKPTSDERRRAADTSNARSRAEPEKGLERAEAPGPARWPYPATLHPIVASMPASAETSIESVARYIKDHEPDAALRVKALHDYAADRIAYDFVAYEGYLRGTPIGSESAEAEAVFRNKRGVCAGYAHLLVAFGKVTGDEIVYVAGNVRGEGFGVSGSPHAWNAAKVDGTWKLVDATWDRPRAQDRPAEKIYRTDYLFTPPDVFAMDHLPDDPEWQLRVPPMEKSEFFRQPMLSPSFRAKDLVLVSPDRAQVAAGSEIDVEIRNPRKIGLLPDVSVRGSSEHLPCDVDVGTISRVHCAFPRDGVYLVRLFSATNDAGRFEYDGQIEVNSRAQ